MRTGWTFTPAILTLWRQTRIVEYATALAATPAAPPRLGVRLAWYAGVSVLAGVLIALGLRLDRADLSCPFSYDGDALLILPLVKATVERGFGGHWRNERLGAPGILELHDFPVIDHLHFFLLWLLGHVATDPGLLFNLYYLLTYPLSAFTAMVALRRLGLSFPAAAIGAILYAFLPAHDLRGEAHYFLAAYWMVPLSLLPVLRICEGNFPFYSPRRGRRRLSWQAAGMFLLMAVTACAGAYYAFFTCAFLAFAGVYGSVAFRTRRAAISAGFCIATIVTVGVLQHLPTVLYQHEHGCNPVTQRFSREADLYGLKIAHLVLPIDDHNLRQFARLKARYSTRERPLENENRMAALGLVGTVGLVGLVAALLLPLRVGWPYRPLAGLTLFGVLLATLGGFGSVFNLLAFANIRAYNRISVFVAFFCIFATVQTIDRLLASRRESIRVGRYAIPAKSLAWIVVLALGFLDQTPHRWFRGKTVAIHDLEASRYRADRRFFTAIEATLPAESALFCLPYAQYPESAQHDTYDGVRGYLHTQTLRWSYGAMKGREADAWQVEVSFLPPEEMGRRLVSRGFAGIYVDLRHDPALESTIAAIQARYAALVALRSPGTRNARLPELVHEDGRQRFLDLRPYRDELRAANPVEFDAHARAEREWVAVLWMNGFHTADPPSVRNPLRWGPADGEVDFINPADRSRQLQVTFAFRPISVGDFRLQLSGAVTDDFTLHGTPSERETAVKTYRLTLLPGRNSLHIHCTPPSHYFFPEDNRSLCYQVVLGISGKPEFGSGAFLHSMTRAVFQKSVPVFPAFPSAPKTSLKK